MLANDQTGEVIYTPPEGEDRLRTLLANWERFLHNETELDPLIRMAVGHDPFEAIHPFADGNGRTGRVIHILFLIQQELLNLPILYLSRHITDAIAQPGQQRVSNVPNGSVINTPSTSRSDKAFE